MPLPDLYREMNGDDLYMRVGNSVISYKNEPFLVRSIGGTLVTGLTAQALASKDFTITSLSIEDPELSVCGLGGRLGFFQFSSDAVGLCKRVPIRQYSQGISSRNTSLYHLSRSRGFGIFHSPDRAPALPDFFQAHFVDLEEIETDQDAVRTLFDFAENFGIRPYYMLYWSNPGFIQAFQGKYDPVLPRIATLEEGNYVVNKDYYLSIDSFRHAFLCNDMGPVATVQPGSGLLRFSPDKEYLTDTVYRQLGLRAEG